MVLGRNLVQRENNVVFGASREWEEYCVWK